MTVLDQLGVLADGTRCRILCVLEGRELTVSELCSALDLPQSTVSRHLRHLGDQGWTTVRREGSRRYYRFRPEGLEGSDARLWQLVSGELRSEPDVEGDQQRLAVVLEARRSRSASFFHASAEQWDRLRSELFGERFDLYGLLGLLDPSWVVADLGCGTGAIAETLAPFVHRVIAVDASSDMLAAARRRLGKVANVELRHGDLEDLQFEPGSLDAAILFLSLQYTADPWRVLRLAHEALVPGGPLLIVDLEAHEDEGFRESMGHVWQGFSRDVLEERLRERGFGQLGWVRIPTTPRSAAEAPGLFLLSAREVAATRGQRPEPVPAREASA